MRMVIPPNAELDPRSGTLTIPSKRVNTLSDDDSDEDSFEALHDCCEQCGTDWKEDDDE